MRKMSNSRGTISYRTIIALIITITLLPIAVSIFSICADMRFDYNLVNNEISLFQLRRIMLISYDQLINNDNISFKYHGEEYNLRIIDDRLVLQPGYQMFLSNVDDICFNENNDVINVCYEMKGKYYEIPIMSKERIYIDEFSCADDERDDTNDSEQWEFNFFKQCLYKFEE